MADCLVEMMAFLELTAAEMVAEMVPNWVAPTELTRVTQKVD